MHVILIIFKTYNTTAGLQDPILGRTLGYDIHRSEPFVQVLHDGMQHWECVSTINRKPDETILMDSLFGRGLVSVATKRQICSILHCQEKNLVIKVIIYTSY